MLRYHGQTASLTCRVLFLQMLGEWGCLLLAHTVTLYAESLLLSGSRQGLPRGQTHTRTDAETHKHTTYKLSNSHTGTGMKHTIGERIQNKVCFFLVDYS